MRYLKSKMSEHQQKIIEKMKEHNKELRRENHFVTFCSQLNNGELMSNFDDSNRSALIWQLVGEYNFLPKNAKDALVFEQYILSMFHDFEQVRISSTKGKNICELDLVGLVSDDLMIVSSCLDIDKTNVYEHLFEVCIQALKYGGIGGISVLLAPNYEFKDDEYDKDEDGSSNRKTIYGVRVFDKKSFETNGQTDCHKFEKELGSFLSSSEELHLASSKGLFIAGETTQEQTEEELPLIMQSSKKSLEFVLDILRKESNFVVEKSLIRFDECLFSFLGVKSEEHNNEWVLVARLDVPPYERSVATKYRRLLFQYIATALKYTDGQFRMLVFHNYDKSLEDEAKTLGEFLSMRVWTMNRREFSGYEKNKNIGIENLLQKWVTGRLKEDMVLVDNIRKANKKIYGDFEVDVVFLRGITCFRPQTNRECYG